MVNANGNVACSAETSVARKVLDIVAVLAYLSFDSFRFNRNNNAITSTENQSLSHTNKSRARRSHFGKDSYIEIVVIVDSNGSRLFAIDWLAYVNVIPFILVCREFEATRPIELFSLLARRRLHIDAECEWVVCSELKHELSYVSINEFACSQEELAWNAYCELTVVEVLSQYVSRNLSITFGQDAILAINSNTCRESDSVRAQVLERDSWSVAHIL